jgi:glycosyltransferase domain-containing protein
MPKLIIPTRNRPTALFSLLNYLARFSPETNVIVADGSTDRYKPLYQKVIGEIGSRLQVDYRPYDPDVSYGVRILSVLNSLSDELVSVGADDDFPVIDTLKVCELFLNAHPDYVLALGSYVGLRLFEDHSVQAACGISRSIEDASAVNRLESYSAWPFQTTYAVARRSHLIERYARHQSDFLVGFYDYTTGIHDCTAGKIKAFGCLGYLRTHTYQHSYLRPDGKSNILKNSGAISKLQNVVAIDLASKAGLTSVDAESLAERVIATRTQHIVAGSPQSAPGFRQSDLFRDPIVQAQYAVFQGLFTDGHSERTVRAPQLRYVMDALLATAHTTDNAGEQSFYESLEAQEHA